MVAALLKGGFAVCIRIINVGAEFAHYRLRPKQ